MNKKLKIHNSGFKREDKSNKIDYTLIPPEVLTRLADWYTKGAIIHGRDNWKKSTDTDTFKQSAYRHLVAVLQDKNDEPHEEALIWNMMCLMWHKENDEKLGIGT